MNLSKQTNTLKSLSECVEHPTSKVIPCLDFVMLMIKRPRQRHKLQLPIHTVLYLASFVPFLPLAGCPELPELELNCNETKFSRLASPSPVCRPCNLPDGENIGASIK